MMKLIISTAAHADLLAAAHWYDHARPGVGDTFLQHVDDTLERIAWNPQLYPVIYQDMRRAKLQRFPYNIYYRVRSDEIEIFGVRRGHRDPAAIVSRIQGQESH